MSVLLGLGGIISGLYYVFTYPSAGGFSGYFDKPSLVLLVAVPPSIMLLSHQVSDFWTGITTLVHAMFDNTRRKQTNIINSLTICSAQVRSSGVGALVKQQKTLKYDLMKEAISMIVNNFTSEEIQHNILAKINARQTRMALAANLFENMAKVCPGVGMIGTLMGLISMMSSLGGADVSKLGGGMALALITTLYGLMLGTILYAPFGEKITLEAERIHELDLLVLNGALALKDKKSSLHMKDIVKTYGKQQGPATPTRPSKPKRAPQ